MTRSTPCTRIAIVTLEDFPDFEPFPLLHDFRIVITYTHTARTIICTHVPIYARAHAFAYTRTLHALDMCMRVSIHADMHTYTHKHAAHNVYVRTDTIHTRMDAYTQTHATRSECARIYPYTHVHTCTCSHAPRTRWSCVRVCPYTYVCTYTQ